MCIYDRTLGVTARKLTLRVVPVRLLAKSSWGTLKESYAQQSLALVHSTSKYCDPA